MFKKFVFDVDNLKKPKSKKAASLSIEKEFARALKKIARASGGIVESHVVGSTVVNATQMMNALTAYSKALTPWAKVQAEKILASTFKRVNSDKAYQEQAKKIGRALSAEIYASEIDILYKQMLDEQVGLIKSIPIEAGERAQKLALEGVSSGRRADEIAAELMKTTEVTESRATLIARTETARVNTALNLARATSVGSTEYTWVTSGDSAVRDSHKKMNGKKFKWNNPPTLSDGTTGHPGTFPNCRCYAEAILPDD